MAVTVNSLGQVANVAAVTKSGGTLDASTTYYVRVDAYKNLTGLGSGGDLRFPKVWGLPSTEISFTTDATKKAVDITWDALAGADGYKVYVSKESGDYWGANKSVYAYNAAGTTETSLELTAEPTNSVNIFYNRSWLRSNEGLTLPGNVPIDGRRLGIQLAGTCTLQDIKDAVDTAGFNDHCSYDGFTFVLRGFICSLDGGGSTTFAPRFKNIYLVEGDIASANASATFSFGVYDSVEKVADQKCLINIMGYSNAFIYCNLGTINLFCDVKGKYGTNSITSYNAGYFQHNDSGLDLTGASVEGFSVLVQQAGESLDDFILRNTGDLETYDDVNNIKIYNGRFVFARVSLDTWKNIEVFQDPAFCSRSHADIQYSSNNTPDDTTPSLYNFTCLRANNQPCIQWSSLGTGNPTMRFYSQVTLKIVDKDNNAISGATVTVLNTNGTQEFSVSTNASGEFATEQYVLSQSAVPTSGNGVATTWTTYSPFTITIQKAGYESYRGIFTITTAIDWEIALRRSPYVGRDVMGDIAA
jgi:hypothetical protein